MGIESETSLFQIKSHGNVGMTPYISILLSYLEISLVQNLFPPSYQESSTHVEMEVRESLWFSLQRERKRITQLNTFSNISGVSNSGTTVKIILYHPPSALHLHLST